MTSLSVNKLGHQKLGVVGGGGEGAKSLFYFAKSPIVVTFPKNLILEKVHRNSHQKCSEKKIVLKNFAIFSGKHLCWSLFLTKLQAYRCFPVNIAKFLRLLLLGDQFNVWRISYGESRKA